MRSGDDEERLPLKQDDFGRGGAVSEAGEVRREALGVWDERPDDEGPSLARLQRGEVNRGAGATLMRYPLTL